MASFPSAAPLPVLENHWAPGTVVPSPFPSNLGMIKASCWFQPLGATPYLVGSLNPSYTSLTGPFIKLFPFKPFWVLSIVLPRVNLAGLVISPWIDLFHFLTKGFWGFVLFFSTGSTHSEESMIKIIVSWLLPSLTCHSPLRQPLVTLSIIFFWHLPPYLRVMCFCFTPILEITCLLPVMIDDDLARLYHPPTSPPHILTV